MDYEDRFHYNDKIMNKEAILKEVERFAKERLSGEGTGHDWWHIERVRNNARLINETEKGDPFVIELAVLLHDIGDRKVIKQEEDDHSIAKNFLEEQCVSNDAINKAMFIIENMSFSISLNKQNTGAPVEFHVAQDADRLDAIGAIGVARAFAYGGSKQRPLYDPTKKTQELDSTEIYRKLDSSTFHHFEEKLFLLKDLMNTTTAKEIAEERDAFMKEYLERFLDEWNGRK